MLNSDLRTSCTCTGATTHTHTKQNSLSLSLAWCMPLMPAPGVLRQEDCHVSKTSPGYGTNEVLSQKTVAVLCSLGVSQF